MTRDKIIKQVQNQGELLCVVVAHVTTYNPPPLLDTLSAKSSSYQCFLLLYVPLGITIYRRQPSN